MSRPNRLPDAEVTFELTSNRDNGQVKQVFSGYRPIYEVKSDYWTSTHHEFIDSDVVTTGESRRAEVWFLTPEAYPGVLWVGKVLRVAEGSRQIGVATVLAIANPLLERPSTNI